MRYTALILGMMVAILCASVSSIHSSGQDSLAEIYESGQISLDPVLPLDDGSLPKGTFFEAPVDLAFGPEGNVYICDYKTHNIKVFDSSGSFLKTLGRKGQGPGEFQMPFHLGISGGRMAVWELGNRRLSLLTESGELITSLAKTPSDGWPRKIRSIPGGEFVIERVKTFYGDNEKPQHCLIEVYSKQLERKKEIFSQEIWENKYITSPRRINVPQPFTARVYWDVTPGGKIVIGYSEKYSIGIYDRKKGKISEFSRKYNPVKVTEKEKQEWFSGMTTTTSGGGIKRGAPDYIIKNTKFPKTKPVFHSVAVDGEGNILVFRNSEGEMDQTSVFDAFRPSGKFIGEVAVKGAHSFPGYGRIYGIGPYFWIRGTNEEGMHTIVKYKVNPL